MEYTTDLRLRDAHNLLNNHRREDAVRVLAKLLEEDASVVEGWYLLGLALEDEERKIYAFERVLKLDPHHTWAAKQLERLKGPPRATIEDSVLGRAKLLARRGERNAAQKLLARFLREYPDSEQGWYFLGELLSNPVKKIHAFKQALKLNPDNLATAKKLRGLQRTQGFRGQAPVRPVLPDEVRPRSSIQGFLGLARYALTRIFFIGITIVLGVFVTVAIANKTGQIDANVAKHIEREARNQISLMESLSSAERQIAYQRLLSQMQAEAGLELPYLARSLRWTTNALTFDWGDFIILEITSLYPTKPHYQNVRSVILERLPNSLMLVGTADLFIFLVGIPVALRLAGKEESWLNRLLNFLAPLSSIPSWVFGLLLISIVAVELRLLPIGGMFDIYPPETKIGYVPIVLKHMILPVAAIILSMIFQMTYAWRTFFSIFSREDYVELAKAKGLRPKVIERKYILRPSIPFVITTFTLTLVSFWQLTTALEVVFAWPGIGKLYVDSLPNYWGMSYFPGEMSVSIAIVVLFAYLLGLIVLILDFVYAIVDPRVRVWNSGTDPSKLKLKKIKRSRGRRYKNRGPKLSRRPATLAGSGRGAPEERGRFWPELGATIKTGLAVSGTFLREFARYPSAILGLVILTVLLCGSIYAVIALPYADVGLTWYQEAVSGEIYRPRLGRPLWSNWFRKEELLSTIILKSEDGSAEKTFGADDGSLGPTASFTFQFDYHYSDVPEEMFFYFQPDYEEKRPFLSATWITPDGREIAMSGFSVEARTRMDLAEYIPRSAKQFSTQETGAETEADEFSGSPDLFPLFLNPESDSLTPVQGRYTVIVDAFLFEEGADLEGELVVLGHVYGLAGTDFSRRELIVPLLWGMPFALGFGLLGALVTTLLAMTIAAAGVWFGGWIDSLVQRLTEANMIIPVLAIGVLLYSIFNVELWIILVVIVLMNVFSIPTKAFRAAFLQIREAPYIEAAQSYGASNSRIIFRYMVPKIVPTLVPQLVALIPSYVFLEATLGFFNVNSIYPTWGKIIYEAIHNGASFGSRYWVLQPLALLLLTGLAFGMLGYALERILNPKLRVV